MKIKTNILLRIYFVFGIISLSGIAIVWKVYYIQNYKDGFWVRKSEELSTRIFSIPAERGNIYTFDDRLLATSIPYFDLYVDFGAEGMTQDLFNRNVDSLAIMMAQKFQAKSVEKYKRELIQAKKAKKRYYLIKRNVDYATLTEIKQWPLFREGKYKGGLITEIRQSRKNPYSILALRTIGENRENAPSVGIEASYNQYLAGVKGTMLKQKIAGNTWMPIHNESAIEPKNGKDIVSTLNINLQDAAEHALAKALDSSNADFGCAVVMEVHTGAIRAIANLGRTRNGKLWEIDNYAIRFQSEPGSTFKLASYLMLLDMEAIRPNDTINIGGGQWNFYGRRMADDHIHETAISIREAFARSSNIAIARLIDRHFKKRRAAFYRNMENYGLTDLSGIDLIGEVKPRVTKPNTWSNLSLPWRATGYEQMFTPIQILTFYNTVANGGYRAKPYLIEKIVENGKVIKTFGPEISSKPIAKEKAILQVQELLRSVIEHPKGTGHAIQSAYFSLAGKSGTAKIRDASSGTYSNANQAMFAGFFPAEKPRYSCVVMIYNPKGIYRTGGGLAAPVFKEIAEKALATDVHISPTYKELPIEKQPVLAQTKGETQQLKTLLSRYGYSIDVGDEISYIDVEVKHSGVRLKPTVGAEAVVPDLSGMNFDDALFLLENMGLVIQYNGFGKVVSQSLAPGTRVKKGDPIQITMKTGA